MLVDQVFAGELLVIILKVEMLLVHELPVEELDVECYSSAGSRGGDCILMLAVEVEDEELDVVTVELLVALRDGLVSCTCRANVKPILDVVDLWR